LDSVGRGALSYDCKPKCLILIRSRVLLLGRDVVLVALSVLDGSDCDFPSSEWSVTMSQGRPLAPGTIFQVRINSISAGRSEVLISSAGFRS
jgi:hypothetical protein